ncbi:putative transmembrane protein [Toxoplasma gondii TgCatPRC2]|uniref:Transmembrane protein n=14 Tax=Toxoplasma gondii TaxID=5811 RepID=A0A125YMQ1_TOXGV|nr:hypothetical protein TGME49_288265 [Toxoplasma gondii ME49]EPR59872.1 hypothetical protein TGGT1_288265 [Toxoplasma gondii GT1]ESS33828.1 putative transmembrane protein [Toxoplasma gondii VEG]KAF4644320.1 hypothetical protein TGRH88_013130 [Toxoplasma gondii]KFG28928.1 putative transmembrane protein [Toxoplasma gondii p89]KFG42956.1 putative transmembrane protein [Toxoplasma gondii GAB2-2007-GAL-DOM2]KFG53181.1 putative transmembrane protein [Toxoplasma gondii FOU]KFH08754.1 putative tran|eukprot:XP_018636351.1 hypothetical protein TGME49_288265 [Toxoplasma gondii ME49]
MEPMFSGTNRTIFIYALLGWILGVIGAGLWHWHRIYVVCMILFSTVIFLYITISFVLEQLRSNRSVQLLAASLACAWSVGLVVASICKTIDAADICDVQWVGEDHCTLAVSSAVCTWCSCLVWLLCGITATKNSRAL